MLRDVGLSVCATFVVRRRRGDVEVDLGVLAPGLVLHMPVIGKAKHFDGHGFPRLRLLGIDFFERVDSDGGT